MTDSSQLPPAKQRTVATYRARWLLSAACVVYVLASFWLLYGVEWGRWYSPSPYQRLQVEAFLNGHLALSPNVENLDFDLAWQSKGGVQQVWGLGVPLWKLPFEAGYRVLGKKDCPEIIALLSAVGLLAWYVIRTALVIKRLWRSPVAGLLFAYLFLLYEPFWNLVLGFRLVYEETCLYACILSMALLVGLVRFTLLRKRFDFFVVCGLAALSGLVRPTHALYGMVAAGFCGSLLIQEWWQQRRGKKDSAQPNQQPLLVLFAGWSIVVAGFAFLAYSNWVRFGSMTEFGHRLTVSGDVIVYLTRFENPYKQVGFWAAGKELFGWVFLAPLHHAMASNALPWEVPALRWRDVYQYTFDLTWLLLFILGGVAAAGFLGRRWRRRLSIGQWMSRRQTALIVGLGAWFLASVFGMGMFYLYFPTLSTRYILDFAPGFLAPLLGGMLLLVRRRQRFISGLVLGWLVVQMGLLLFLPNRGLDQRQPLLSRSEILPLAKPEDGSRKLADFDGGYSLTNFPTATGILQNGNGWGEDGHARAIVQVVVDRPQFIELVTGAPTDTKTNTAEICRAIMDNLELPMESVVPFHDGTTNLVRVRFGVPERILRQNGDQLLNLCFMSRTTGVDLRSVRPLWSIQWRTNRQEKFGN